MDTVMLAYSTYSEAGGVGKTTTAANLAVAHAQQAGRGLKRAASSCARPCL